jgi:hypothetical protein
MLACGATGKIRDAAARTKTVNDLKQLGMSYHNFHDSNARGPRDPQEWANSPVISAEEKPLIAQTGPGGRFVIAWNVKFSQMTAGLSQTVLGYESHVPTAGGPVLMADGSVVMMTAADFAQAPKPPAAGK